MTIVPLVGMHYRPPAKAITGNLQPGHPLLLVAEPENEFDPHAIAVYLDPETIETSEWMKWDNELQSYGFDAGHLAEGPHIQLGYVSRHHTDKVHPYLESGTASCLFHIMATGGPGVNLSHQPAPKEAAE
jgi:hypothetical protein